MKIPERILIIRTDRLGDVILSTPVIKNLRLVFPQSHIAFLCRPYTYPAVKGNPYLNEIIVYDKNGCDKSVWATLQFAWRLRRKKFAMALILHPTSRAHWISFIAGIPIRVGWDRKCSFLLTRRLAYTKYKGEKHESEYSLDLLRALDLPIEDKDLFFPLSVADKTTVENVLEKAGVGPRDRLIVIHPSASCPSRCWPAEHYSRLVGYLKKGFDCRIALIASLPEKNAGQKIVADHLEIIDLRGKLTVGEVGALLKRADLFITNDSGPSHIAAALNSPVITLFGRNDPGLSPRCWRPLGPHSFYIHKDVGCRECAAHNCTKGFLCLEAISPEEVYDLAFQVIQAGL